MAQPAYAACGRRQRSALSRWAQQRDPDVTPSVRPSFIDRWVTRYKALPQIEEGAAARVRRSDNAGHLSSVGKRQRPLTSSGTVAATLRVSAPLICAGLAALWAERVGIVNIGIEGMMILGTWAGGFGAWKYGPWVGLLLGILGGTVGGMLHALATVRFNVDHVISGVAINILAGGAYQLCRRRPSSASRAAAQQSPPAEGTDSFDQRAVHLRRPAVRLAKPRHRRLVRETSLVPHQRHFQPRSRTGPRSVVGYAHRAGTGAVVGMGPVAHAVRSAAAQLGRGALCRIEPWV